MVHRLSILVILLALLAACGGAPAAVAPTSAPAGAEPTTAPTSAAAATRTITDARSEQVVVPAAPQRVVALTEHDLDSALALGITPVGAVNGRGQPGLPAYLGERISGIESVGSLAEPSLEKVAALNPDLILAGNLIPQIEALLPELTQIAPVVKTYSVGEDWKTAFVGTANALNRVAEAEAFLADYEARVSAIRAMLPADRAVEASVVRWMPEGPVVMMPSIFSSLVLADIGLTRPAAQAALAGSHGAHSDPVSLEQLELIDGDWIFIGALNAEGSVALETARTNPLFQQLDAVQAGHVAVVDGAVWTSIGGPLAALQVLDDVAAALAAAPVSTATRTVTDDLGRTVEVPARPQRVVALQDLQVLRPLLDLGVTPIASVTHPRAEGAYRFVEEYDVSGVEAIGLLGEPSLERLVALKPDLIIGTLSAGTQDQLETLSAIAPTLVYNAGRPVIDYHRSLAEAVGALEAYDALMADYETRLDELRAGVAPISDELVVSLLSFNPNADQIEISEGPYTLIFRGAGIQQPEPQVNFESADEGVRRYWISLEQLPAHDADLILLLYSNDPSVNTPITSSPIWEQLAAVKAGQVVEIDGGTWYVQSVRSLFNVIDALEQHLVGAEVDTSVMP